MPPVQRLLHSPGRAQRSSLALRVALVLGLAVAQPAMHPGAGVAAQATPQTERPVTFDSAGRITVMTPTLASRFALHAPAWPVTGSFREARLFAIGTSDHVLVVTRADGSLTRYPLAATELAQLREAVELAVQNEGTLLERNRSSDVASVSAPAGNEFVRNQTILGLIAYGPAASAILSEAGAEAAVTAYFVAAGGSFFAAANMVKYRTVTRAQASLGSHGGLRGALAGLAVANIFDADGGAEYGIPILTGALGGTVAGYQFARGLSDGEASSSGLVADLTALTTLGVSGALGAFKERQVLLRDFEGNPVRDVFGNEILVDDGQRGVGKAALAAAIGTGILGYAVGPRYARRTAYNVTSGDAKTAFAASLLGAFGAFGVVGDNAGDQAGFAAATAGLLGGFLVADRTLVRSADRSASDGTLIQLGTLAGGLIGGGVAAAANADGQVAALMVAAGGALGLLATDRTVAPPRDAGPLRGITPSGDRETASRVTFTPGALAMALAFHPRGAARLVDGVPQLPLSRRPVSTPIPVLRIAW